MALDIKLEAQNIQNMYRERKSSRLISALVLGNSGSGKTKLLETCPRPIHIDSFDPDGCTTVRRGIEEGWILADTRYEQEDPTDPSAFELWDAEYNRRKDGGYFDGIGTYAIDSLSMFSDAVMSLVLKGLVRKADRSTAGKSGAAVKTDLLRIPQENDWPLQMNIITNAIRDILTLPCSVILTGHVEDKKNKQGVVISKGLYATGRLAMRLPRLFEEIYYMKAEESSKENTYWLYTQPTDGIDARTRIGRGKFDFKEKPDICYLLEKAGLKPAHKEMSWIEKGGA